MDKISAELTEVEHNAVVDDMSKIYPTVITQLVALADKHNVDRDDLIKYFAAMFSAMAEISTLANWGGTMMNKIERKTRKMIEDNFFDTS